MLFIDYQTEQSELYIETIFMKCKNSFDNYFFFYYEKRNSFPIYPILSILHRTMEFVCDFSNDNVSNREVF